MKQHDLHVFTNERRSVSLSEILTTRVSKVGHPERDILQVVTKGDTQFSVGNTEDIDAFLAAIQAPLKSLDVHMFHNEQKGVVLPEIENFEIMDVAGSGGRTLNITMKSGKCLSIMDRGDIGTFLEAVGGHGVN